MATVAIDSQGGRQGGRQGGPAQGGEVAFGMKLAIAMALTAVAGFGTQYLMGRSSFASPLRVHLHGIAFFGWIALFVVQSRLGVTGRTALHRRLGWFSMGWMGLMLFAGCWVIVAAARNGTVPFFFRPQHFLVENPGTILIFIGLTCAAVAMRRQTDWHVRLHVCALTAIMGPAFGRLLPMPLLVPYAFEAAGAASLVFPVAGIIRDLRVHGRVHPAWWTGLAALVGGFAAVWLVAHSPAGEAIYRMVTAGYPGAAISPLDFAAPPAPPA